MRHLIPSPLVQALASRLRQRQTLRVDCLCFAALALVGLLASGDVLAEAVEAASFEVEIRNISDPSGALYVQVLEGETAYRNSAPAAARLVLPAQADSIRFSFDSLPPGEYAVRVMQDLDGDGKLKTNMVGMPQEPWGVSNDARGRFGPPSWDQVRIIHPAESSRTHVITLH